MLFRILYGCYNLKWTFILSIVFSTIGSGISSIGRSSTELIIGRAINGLCSVGISQGVSIILVDTTHPSNHQWFLASLAIWTSIVVVSGPVITGAIIDKALWKWIFYVNIQIGGAVILAILLFFEAPKREVVAPLHYRGRPLYFGATLFSSKRTGRLFYIFATMFLIISVIVALLAINWGGRKYFLSIGSLMGVLTASFIVSIVVSLVGYFMAYRTAPNDRWKFIIPLRLFRNRSLVSGIIFVIPINSGFWVLLYYVRFYSRTLFQSSMLNIFHSCQYGFKSSREHLLLNRAL
jgi:MFS family permease